MRINPVPLIGSPYNREWNPHDRQPGFYEFPVPMPGGEPAFRAGHDEAVRLDLRRDGPGRREP